MLKRNQLWWSFLFCSSICILIIPSCVLFFKSESTVLYHFARDNINVSLGGVSLGRIFQRASWPLLFISIILNLYLYGGSRIPPKAGKRLPNLSVKAPFPLKEGQPVEKVEALSDNEILWALSEGQLSLYSLESKLGDCQRAVQIRRKFIAQVLFSVEEDREVLSDLPWKDLNYKGIFGRNCENVIGYTPVPVGVAGPIRIDMADYYIPLSTTEGALVASTSRGCKACNAAGGVSTALTDDGMTRGPVVAFPNLDEAFKCCQWLRNNLAKLARIFNGTSKHATLTKIDTRQVGKLVYLRFKAKTGDAMGMNMMSRATQAALSYLKDQFPLMRVISLSGNYCSDKKACAINWIDGRGKSVTAETVLPATALSAILKTSATTMAELNMAKNMIGSMAAGASGGGCNAHAANIVAAMFIALGQDPAQIVSSASCLTVMETINGGRDLYVSCTMPCLEVGTIGGGTALAAQRSCLSLLQLDRNITGSDSDLTAARLARIVVATVLAAEVSLMASLAEGSLVDAHQTLNSSTGK